MKSALNILEDRISTVLSQVSGIKNVPAMVKVSGRPEFGDYQANGIMAVAKRMKTNPRKLAEQVVEKLDIADVCEPPEIAGPGFINLRLRGDFLSRQLMDVKADTQRLGVETVDESVPTVVDFSGPNIAKQMHVGHLRSSILGDCICRMLEFLGNDVIRQNHIGDWGTQFGMLIGYMLQQNPEAAEKPETIEISDLEQFYRNAKEKFDEDEQFKSFAREQVTKLHNHDPAVIKVWQQIVDQSRKHYEPIYSELGVKLTKEDERGESFYAEILPSVVKELEDKGLAQVSEGAVCVFPEGFTNKEGNPLAYIIQKSDGAYLYATTDLAALKFRVEELKAKKIIYVTDARQKLHFDMLFQTARQAGWTDDLVETLHVTFGSVMGEDGKPFKTRSGENVKLKDLLDEAVERAKGVVEEKNPDLSADRKEAIARAVGIGAVKYADYSNNRDSDYIFSFERMLAMEGNTAPYMQYAYARVKSIERKAAEKGIDASGELDSLEQIELAEPAELELAKHLIRYSEAIESAAADCRCNYLTTYLYELAQKFSGFYTACPVLGAAGKVRAGRLLLCDLTARTIRHGLEELLGIDVVEQM